MTRLAHPKLVKTILPWLHSPTQQPSSRITSRTFPRSYETAKRQLSLGQTTVFKGFLSEDWIGIQDDFLRWNSRRTTGERWISRLIKQLWEVAWDLWQFRIDIIKKGNTATEILIRQDLNQQITQRYNEYQLNPLPSLTKWFLRSRQEISEYSVENQRQWIEQIDALRRLHDIQQPANEDDSEESD